MNKAYERETEMRNQIFKEYTLVDLRNLNLQVETMSVVQGIQSDNKSVCKNLRQTGSEKASPNLFVIKRVCETFSVNS